MKSNNIIRKLTSRKLWVSVGSFVSMMIVATGGTESEAAQVAALIMSGATVLGYVIGEGLIDGSNKKTEFNSVKFLEREPGEESEVE